MEQKVTSTISKGLIISLILIVLDLVGHYAHLILNDWFKWIPTLILCIAIIWSCISYASQMNGNVTFGNTFAHGFKVSATVACITFLFTLISLYLLFPDFVNQIVDKAVDQMHQQGKLTEDQIQQAIPMIKKFTPITIIAGSIIGTLIVGVIAALIGAAVAKKNPQASLDNQFK
jgi:uncharacterized membrane protein YciS (DUF1049 family)